MLEFLRNNVDVFPWSTYDGSGIDPEFICHQLNVSPDALPRRQPPQHSSKEHVEAVKEETNELKQARVIKKVFLS